MFPNTQKRLRTVLFPARCLGGRTCPKKILRRSAEVEEAAAPRIDADNTRDVNALLAHGMIRTASWGRSQASACTGTHTAEPRSRRTPPRPPGNVSIKCSRTARPSRGAYNCHRAAPTSPTRPIRRRSFGKGDDPSQIRPTSPLPARAGTTRFWQVRQYPAQNPQRPEKGDRVPRIYSGHGSRRRCNTPCSLAGAPHRRHRPFVSFLFRPAFSAEGRLPAAISDFAKHQRRQITPPDEGVAPGWAQGFFR